MIAIRFLLLVGLLLASETTGFIRGFERCVKVKSNYVRCWQESPKKISFGSKEWNTVAWITGISAPLGTLLDNQHGLFHTLEYTQYQVQLSWGNHLLLTTAVWVPFLFGVAGFIMSSLQLLFDQLFAVDKIGYQSISWPKVFYGIGFFASQYYLSGLLDATTLFSSLQINLLLSGIAFIGLYLFDRSRSGLLLAIATALGGPLIEIAIIQFLHIYRYTHADLWGICSWIPAVYFLGAPAVGNLTRKIHSIQKEGR